LCAIELGGETVQLIRSATELAQAWQAKLRLVHAVPVDETRPEKYLEGDLSAALIKNARAEVAQLLQHAGDLEVTVEGGRASRVIRDAALQFGADLLVTGRGKLHETLGQIRTNTYEIIRESPCPVLSA
jgi:nucleotide-binding universal stress UspA family protein